MAATFFTGAASNTIGSVGALVIPPLIQLIDDAIHLDQNTQIMQDKLSGLRYVLQYIGDQFQHDQRSLANAVNHWSQKLRGSLDKAIILIERSQQEKQCLDYLFCKPARFSRQIRKCRANFDELLSELDIVFSLLHNAQQIALSRPPPPETLLQPVPDSGFVGLGIEAAEVKVQEWLNMEDRQSGVIGIYGMGGVGKTSLLKRVYNGCKQGNVFEPVIWVSVSQNFDIVKMQNFILGRSSNAESSRDAETLKMELFAYLKEKKFILVLDDMWNQVNLQEEVGIPVGNDKGSKVLISTRSKEVVRKMRAHAYSIEIQPLSQEEGWELFCRIAGVASTESIKDVARQIAAECKGLPLAITVVAAAMKDIDTVDDWYHVLSQMKTVDPLFLNDRDIDKDLYQRLKVSYTCLPYPNSPDPNLQNCFLYCGAFPDDAHIEVELLVEMWISEGLIQGRESNKFAIGRQNVKQLVERCLFEEISGDMTRIKVHDIVRDMAIFIAEKEEHCLFRTSQNLQDFPVENGIENSKRIAISNNDILSLPADLTCPKLLTLILASNRRLIQAPNGFFVNLTSLRVLDMSYTNIQSLPVSMWHLTQLEFLSLRGTSIKSLPEDICNLVRLQFLHLSACTELESLTPKIGELKTLKHLDLDSCKRLAGIPRQISQLHSLNKLGMWWCGIGLKPVEEDGSDVCSLKDLTNIPDLIQLSVKLKSGPIGEGIMGAWSKMRRLTLDFKEDGGEDLPQDMVNMTELQLFKLLNYRRTNLPSYICTFNQLEDLHLVVCYLRELPPLERLPKLKRLTLWGCGGLRELGIGSWESAAGFPMLEELYLHGLDELESMTRSSSNNNIVWSEGFMPKLQILRIFKCPSLKRVPKETIKLPNLREIEAEKGWWENLIWEDDNVKKLFEDKFKR